MRARVDDGHPKTHAEAVMMRRTGWALLCTAVLMPRPLAAAPTLIGRAGTFEIGGQAYARYYRNNFGDRRYETYRLELLPAVGWFLRDRFLLRAQAKTVVDLIDDRMRLFLGLKLEPIYTLPLDSSWIYFGVSAGWDQINAEGPVVGGLAGLLIPLSDSVALDVGGRVDYSVSLAVERTRLQVPIGLLGVRAYLGD